MASPIPETRVTSATPTPSESTARDSYFAPTKRPHTNGRISSPAPIPEHDPSDPELSRARTRSRSPQLHRKLSAQPIKPQPAADTNATLSPSSALGMGASYWRSLSRSPSPLGLIPIHREWRTFIHRHEIPRKALHVSIGFFTLYLYRTGAQTSAIHPPLLAALVPIFAIDFARMHYPPLNRIYIRYLGALMRESEAHDRYNGVISYLAGAWAVMRFCPKDVAVMSILLLSWCDTAASTFGRLWGKYTPRVRKGKSLAGTIAAFVVGVAAALSFWLVIAPTVPAGSNTGANAFAFDGTLTLPSAVRDVLGWTKPQSTVAGGSALAVASVASGLIGCISEAIDVWGLDDNLTIPLLSGIGLTAFFRTFGEGLP